MTYCIGIKTTEGLVFASDSRTNAGLDNVNIYSKMLTYDVGDRTVVIVTSGNLATSQAVFKSIEKDIKENSDLNILLEKDQNNFFCANEPKNKEYFANGVFGSSKNNILLMKIIEYLKTTYQETKKKYPNKYDIWRVTGPVPFLAPVPLQTSQVSK